jgi:membrane-bound lytic murein transglycosylase D
MGLWGFFLFLTLARAADPAADAPALATESEGRRAVRGLVVEQASESPELAELRRFEERAFPRGVAVPDGPVEGLDPAFLSSLELPDLPVKWDPRVLRYLQFYKSDPKGRAIMSAWLRKQGRWRAMFEDVLHRHGLPLGLMYVSMIESGYEPNDLSRVGAVGLWQFMESGGKIYGLERNFWVDQRKNPERSTEAYALYMHDLWVRFGNWHLLLGAFNAGYGAMLHSMQKYNTNDFWELCKHESGLPWETCLYVPKAIATAIVGMNREKFGYGDVPSDPPFAYDRARVPGGTPLAAAAHACGAAESELVALNPELRRNRVPPGREYDLRIPRGSLARFVQSFGGGHGGGGEYEVYTLRFGERIEDVARARRVPVKELKRLNSITDSTEVRGGTEILVPRERGKASEAELPPPDDEQVLVPLPERDFAHAGKKRIFYRTRDGDRVRAVAEFFGVPAADVAAWNNLTLDANLASRMMLQLYVPERASFPDAILVPDDRIKIVTVGSEEFLEYCEAKRGRKRTTYTCKAGDTLAKVGRRFGLTPGDLARINQFSYASELKPGQQIIVYVPVTAQAKKEARGRLRQAARLQAKFGARKRTRRGKS